MPSARAFLSSSHQATMDGMLVGSLRDTSQKLSQWVRPGPSTEGPASATSADASTSSRRGQTSGLHSCDPTTTPRSCQAPAKRTHTSQVWLP
eukprot:CAMPEP_0204155438 /NCGR_PEP_ID=MMETSP0361-20130328/29597_1 /ASSEMBLY_ACC=CAM_ASM_000343 /TAXON_ID=268821 /ORGANISM="Scrippsiella Hangoei, Strain SHTV-5" /LENGTH=91 /DNA_ID=CAMNT_0051110915 /DNA_START=65 /DNA_END=336 /DNA_ORIENTATION=+